VGDDRVLGAHRRAVAEDVQVGGSTSLPRIRGDRHVDERGGSAFHRETAPGTATWHRVAADSAVGEVQRALRLDTSTAGTDASSLVAAERTAIHGRRRAWKQ